MFVDFSFSTSGWEESLCLVQLIVPDQTSRVVVISNRLCAMIFESTCQMTSLFCVILVICGSLRCPTLQLVLKETHAKLTLRRKGIPALYFLFVFRSKDCVTQILLSKGKLARFLLAATISHTRCSVHCICSRD